MMEYISDPNLFKAVSFAASMIKKGSRKGLSIYKAAQYYGVSSTEVASILGKRANRVSKMNKKNSEYRSK